MAAGIEAGELMKTCTHLLPEAKMTRCYADLALLEPSYTVDSCARGLTDCKRLGWASGTSFSHSFCEVAERIGGGGSGFPF